MKVLLSLFLGLTITLSTACATLAPQAIDKLKDDGRFSTLLTALEITGLDEALADAKDFTILAPTDAAFAALPAGTLDTLINNPEQLKGVLLFHVLADKVKAKKVAKKVGFETLSGEFVLTKDIDVLEADIKVRNGIVHALNNVLLPNGIKASPETSEIIDIEKYMGLWYEIGRYKNSFQEKCGQTTAQYSLREDGKVNVVNTCKLKKDEDKKQVAKAIARVLKPETNSVLGVSFVPFFNRFGLFAGDYRILDIGADYEWVIVGNKTREFFWVLSRTPELDETLYQDLLNKAQTLGFDPAKVIKTPTWQD